MIFAILRIKKESRERFEEWERGGDRLEISFM